MRDYQIYECDGCGLEIEVSDLPTVNINHPNCGRFVTQESDEL